MASRKRQRAALVQKIQHAVGGVFLLLQGLGTLQNGPEGMELGIAIVEVVTSGLLIVALARAIRKLRRPALQAHRPAHAPHDHGGHSGIDWIDILIAGVLGAEVLEKWHATGHLARPTVLLALVLVGIGLLHGRIAAFGARRRALRISAAGVSVPLRRPFARRELSWSQIKAIDPRQALIELRSGERHRIDLADVEDAPPVVSALEEAQRRHAASVRVESPPAAGTPLAPQGS